MGVIEKLRRAQNAERWIRAKARVRVEAVPQTGRFLPRTPRSCKVMKGS